MKFAIISFAVLLRILVGFQPHSGQDDYQGPKGRPSPHKYGGDYEAQRHWMEITYHLPIGEWYWHSLEYWGLDYPPLTAYVSWACGFVAHNVGSLHDKMMLENDSDDADTDTDTSDYDNVCQIDDDVECILDDDAEYVQSTSKKEQQIVEQRGGLKAIKDLVALHSSRFGYEDALGKMYMRFTVLLLDLLVYMSAVIAIAKRLIDTKSSVHKESSSSNSIVTTSDQRQLWFLLTALTQPALLLIDHGHFQYNTTSLGLALWSFYFMTQTSFVGCVIGSVLFSLALNFKQMELYHAPAVFAYLLGRCFCNENNSKQQQSSGMNFFGKFCALGVSVILTFAVLWLPFAIYPRASLSTKFHLDGISQVLKRLFPFQRGLFEDKVANIWFSLSVKPLSIRSRVSPDLLPLAALLLTLVMILPACFMLYRVGQRSTSYTPKKDLEFLLWGSVSTSLAFFLASFQGTYEVFISHVFSKQVNLIEKLISSLHPTVHEKGILISLAPLSLLTLDAAGFVMWFSTVATWSLWPLLVIDRLCEAYVCCLVIFLCINAMARPTQLSGEVTFLRSNLATFAAVLSLVVMLCLHLAEWRIVPPAHLPDLFPVLWSLLGCGLFCISYLATIWAMSMKYNITSTKLNTHSRQRSHSSGKGWRKFFFLSYFGIVATLGEAFSPSTHQTIHRGVSYCSSLSAGKESDYFIPNSDHLERARVLLPWEEQSNKDAQPVLNLSAKNSDRLPLADGVDDDAVAASDETNTTPCSWEDGKVWRETEQALAAFGILVEDDSDNKSKELTSEVIIDKVPQLLRLPTDQIVESASFFVGNSTEESPNLMKVLLQLEPSLLTYNFSQLDYGMTYLSNMMFRGDRTAAIQMIQSQCVIDPSMGLQLLKFGVDGGTEETRISSLLSSAGQSSGRAIKGVVGDMSKDIREWKRVKGGKNSLG